MDIRVESVKFDADKKLLDFIHEKVGKLERFFDAIIGVEVTLSLVPGHENKKAAIRVHIPGNDLLVERNYTTFEEAVATCVDILKEKLVKAKERMRGA
ncbi:MAG: HPF/RaiA family ribosome-associated protein [Bacteroidales bacterium]|jgi:putative sigma-54 modulation protein|nr:HPF/RaiA family ribosome-associated protein [Bacteroidales bacterium]HHV40714.1 HPF/RaiA family ribosome-associated protein [Bacteroidales bacterium]